MNIILLVKHGLLIGRKCLPHILVIGGTAMTLAGAIVGCAETPRALEVIADGKEKLEKIEGVHNGEIAVTEGTVYTEEQYKKDVIIQKTNTVKGLVKTYWPAALLLLGGTACVLGGHGLLAKRATALMGAYASLAASYKQYRENVRERFDADTDHQLLIGADVSEEPATVVDEETGEVQATDELNYSIKINPEHMTGQLLFGPKDAHFTGNMMMDYLYLKSKEKDFTGQLHANGNLSVKAIKEGLEKYDEITDEDMITGYVVNGDGDGRVDFGLFDEFGEIRYPMEYDPDIGIPINLNVDGIIYGMLKKGNVRG